MYDYLKHNFLGREHDLTQLQNIERIFLIQRVLQEYI